MSRITKLQLHRRVEKLEAQIVGLVSLIDIQLRCDTTPEGFYGGAEPTISGQVEAIIKHLGIKIEGVPTTVKKTPAHVKVVVPAKKKGKR